MSQTKVSYSMIQNAAVNVVDFGAVGDGTTDSTAAFAAAIASLPGGGKIFVPRGWYRVTSTLMLHSGLELYGESCTNLTFGVPTNNERPSHIFIDSDTGVLFSHTIDVQMESVKFFDLSFASRLFPNTTERGTSTGFLFSGSYPNDIKHMTFDRCQFSNFGGYAIRVYDPNAGGVDPDWNVCPVTMTDCAFYYNTIGIEFEADNADCWVLTNVSFFQNAAAFGINCKRSGFITLISCFGGGGVMVITSGTVRDSITMISCQFENAVAMLQVADTMSTQQTYRPISLISCIIEAPIILGSPCHLISQNSRYVNNIEVTSTGVLIDSLFDSFLNTTAVNLVAGSSVKNFLTNGEQLPIGVRGQIFNGQLVKRTAALPNTGTAAVGDISWITIPAEGKPSGWICVTAGSPGAWLPFGQASHRQSAVTPVGAILPYFVGEELLDNVAVKWYKSVGLLNTDWVALN